MRTDCPKTEAISPDLIRQELLRILESRHFRHSKRARQFLQFVVEQKIDGNEELLKERWIGAKVFGRDLDYSTGDDSIVRVQAGDVRRRLELYQNDRSGDGQVCIELPLGSYSPVFHCTGNDTIPANIPPPADEYVSDQTAEELPQGSVSGQAPFSPLDTSGNDSKPVFARGRHRAAAIGVCLVLVVSAIGYGIWHAHRPTAWMKAFWGPALIAKKPVLICLGNPVVYQPSLALFDRYTAKHPGTFATRVERRNRVLPLEPQETIRWSEMDAIPNSGPAIGGVRAAMNIGALFGSRSVPFSVRFGNEASFPDLRESPAVIIGALNSGWMMQMSADLHFSMQEVQGQLLIREAGPSGRTWRFHSTPSGSTDYALVTRQLRGPTGQFTVKIEGIGDGGTQAGSEIVSDPESLHSALQSLPSDWARQNVQLVVSTHITDGKAGPPKVVASYLW